MNVRVTWNGPQAQARTRAAALLGLRVGAEHLLTESRRVVPIEEGTLERSGAASVDEARMTAAVSYDTPYAVRQHENLTYRHDQGRTAKYLERPATEQRAQIAALLAAQIRRAL
ncbi:minor capsid protein [Streptomyces diastaticus]|uniref:minor capsid protein n=1 Tax=Streptomyces diastaticus TaxID=1956 RepID=UPI0036B88B34